MDLPQTIYAIFPKDEKGNIVGVYIGATSKPLEKRIKGHLNSLETAPNQIKLHELMRNNGFIYQSLETHNRFEDRHLEYYWIDYFIKKTDLFLFNAKLAKNPDYRNCCYGRVGK
jgi:hypothetical protein